MEQIGAIQQNSKVNRPLGVWILTGYALLSAGILPILTLILLEGSGFGLAPSSTWFTALLAMVVIIAAIRTWRGSNRARVLLLVLITTHYALIAFNNVWLLFSDEGLSIAPRRAIGSILRGFLYPALYIWYFGRPETMKFFVSDRQGSVQEAVDG